MAFENFLLSIYTFFPFSLTCLKTLLYFVCPWNTEEVVYFSIFCIFFFLNGRKRSNMKFLLANGICVPQV